MVPVDPKWRDLRPVVRTGRGGWVHNLLRTGVAGECENGVLLELSLCR